MPSNRAADISYYEELGVENDASPSEIHDSFRALVRLLHPDRHVDSHLKLIAERQLRRINRIYAVLSDPEKRRSYDASYEEEYAAPTIVFNPASNIDPKRFLTQFLWIGAAVILAGICIWFFVDGSESPGSDRIAGLARTQALQSPRPPIDALQIEALLSDLRTARSERDAARYEVLRLRALLELRNNRGPASNSTVPRSLSGAPAPVAIAEPAPDVRPAPVPPRSAFSMAVAGPPRPAPTKPLGSDPHQFAGFWFFAPTLERNNKNLYPPQFIEAVLTEKNGQIHGKYRSRYEIVDRAISPDVNFEFTGMATGTTWATLWTGFGGARGQVTLSLTGENSLKLDWTASDLGSSQGLTSGTATLTRRIE
jgi:curved DNA-binding protein CbpA